MKVFVAGATGALGRALVPHRMLGSVSEAEDVVQFALRFPGRLSSR